MTSSQCFYFSFTPATPSSCPILFPFGRLPTTSQSKTTMKPLTVEYGEITADNISQVCSICSDDTYSKVDLVGMRNRDVLLSWCLSLSSDYVQCNPKSDDANSEGIPLTLYSFEKSTLPPSRYHTVNPFIKIYSSETMVTSIVSLISKAI
jgi:hypothetical protein